VVSRVLNTGLYILKYGWERRGGGSAVSVDWFACTYGSAPSVDWFACGSATSGDRFACASGRAAGGFKGADLEKGLTMIFFMKPRADP
jgi:hypothetical protein